MSFFTIPWKLPAGAFFGTAQGRTLDCALDEMESAERLTVWHVTEEQEHFLFRSETAARDYVSTRLLDIGERATLGQCRHALGEYWFWKSIEREDYPSYSGHITIWPHTEQEEDHRQARIEWEYNAACTEALRLFASENNRRVFGAQHWSDFLNAHARRRFQESQR